MISTVEGDYFNGGTPIARSGATPLGYIDHSPFAGFGSELVYGLRSDGSIAHISDVPSGLKCGCICPACQSVLVARKGAIMAPHFAHHGEGRGCGTGAETNAHIWAKQVLEREKYILLPEVAAHGDGLSHRAHKGGLFRFVEAKLERPLGDITPDVLLVTKDGRELLVEVRVTHPCDQDKIAKLKTRALATVEVDLRAYRTSDDRAAIEAALLRGAPRDWLFNRKLDEAEATLAKKIRARADAEAEKERRRIAAAERRHQEAIAAEQRQFDYRVSELDRARIAFFNSRNEAGLGEHQQLVYEGRGHLLLPDLSVAGFTVPNVQWQSVAVDFILRGPPARELLDLPFTPALLLRNLGELVDDRFLGAEEEVAAAFLKRAAIDYMPYDALHVLLAHLCDADILIYRRTHYDYSPRFARHLQDARDKRLREERRQRMIDRAMQKILAAVGSDLVGFDIERWKALPIAPFGKSLNALVEAEEQEWELFDAALLAIETMVEGGAITPETLGLPLAGAVTRCEKKLADARAAAAQEREDALRADARLSLFSEADCWLVEPGASGDSPIVLARRDTEGLREARRALRVAVVARDNRIAHEAVVRKLAETAEKALGKETAYFFVNNHDLKIGAAPRDRCATPDGMQQCLSLLKEWAERKRRIGR